jgi:hypothetical protein
METFSMVPAPEQVNLMFRFITSFGARQTIARIYASFEFIKLARQRMRAEPKALEAQIQLRAKYAELMALLGLADC